MPDYQNGKIYKLWSPEGDDIYIGSTTETLCRRKVGHKTAYNMGKNLTSKILFEKYTDVRIELIEEFPCDKKCKLLAREGHYIRTIDCVNKIVPDRTKQEYDKEYRKEYYKTNKEQIKEHSKKYRENNSNHVKEQQSEKITCECGCETTRSHIARHKKSNRHIKLMENI
jgi:hypothetical protein